jgi:hypothetical protein
MTSATLDEGSVFTGIKDRILALSADDLTAPGNEPGSMENIIILGTMTDWQQRLWTLVFLAKKDLEEETKLVESLAERISVAVTSDITTLSSLINALTEGPPPELLAELTEAKQLLALKHRYHSLVADLFDIELQTAFPEIEGKHHVCFFNDWSVGWHDCKKTILSIMENFETDGFDSFLDSMLRRHG